MRWSAACPPPTKSASCPASRSSSAVSSALRTSSSTTSTRTSRASALGRGAVPAPPREAHDTRRALPLLATDLEIAPRGLYQPSREKETQARAAGLGGEERVAELARDFGRHAASGIADRELERAAALRALELDASALRHGFERVQDQVEEHLLQRLGIERDRRFGIEVAARDRDLAHAELVVEQVERGA